MSDLDRLPPDQRAVLSLVLERGKSYGEVAEMLAIPESAVRDRAHSALDALAGERARAGRERPSAFAPSGTGRAARGAGTKPADSAGPGTKLAGPASAGPGDATPAAGTGPAGPAGPVAARPREPRAARRSPSSRTGGALLLGGILAVIVVAVILISSGGNGKGSSGTSTPTPSTQSTSASNANTPHINKTIALSPLEPSEKANGTAYVLSEKGRYAFYVAARNLPQSSGFFYAVWLYNSPSSAAPLGRAPTVGSDGRMEGGGPLPTNASLYHQLIVTHETSTHPSHPGPIVLRGTFGLR